MFLITRGRSHSRRLGLSPRAAQPPGRKSAGVTSCRESNSSARGMQVLSSAKTKPACALSLGKRTLLWVAQAVWGQMRYKWSDSKWHFQVLHSKPEFKKVVAVWGRRCTIRRRPSWTQGQPELYKETLSLKRQTNKKRINNKEKRKSHSVTHILWHVGLRLWRLQSVTDWAPCFRLCEAHARWGCVVEQSHSGSRTGREGGAGVPTSPSKRGPGGAPSLLPKVPRPPTGSTLRTQPLTGALGDTQIPSERVLHVKMFQNVFWNVCANYQAF